MEEFLSIKEEAKAEITEKKSKFIAEVFYVETVKEAEEAIERVKKREHSAKHHCYAYRIIDEKIIEKMSDDGEPSGTAGAPILSILQGKNLNNVLVIVTRYFGGILLGTGGLVRAYSESATNAIEKAETKKMQKGAEIELEIRYQEYENLKYYLSKINGKIISSEYKDNVKATIQIPISYVDDFTLNYQKLPFKIENSKKVKEKFVDI
ncbi:MAG: YigZ family protein [Clostridia bacterium]|nr:YigZ family protein [Clostridia bacterium]